jgi:hypothetical protein
MTCDQIGVLCTLGACCQDIDLPVNELPQCFEPVAESVCVSDPSNPAYRRTFHLHKTCAQVICTEE